MSYAGQMLDAYPRDLNLDECERYVQMHEHCRMCAEACRHCERACRDLLAAMR